jgi:hypothetical protein
MANKKRKLSPKTVLKLPDLEQSKSAVLNSLTSRSSQRSYDHAIHEFIDWYCSEPRLAFNKTVVTRFTVEPMADPDRGARPRFGEGGHSTNSEIPLPRRVTLKTSCLSTKSSLY